MIPLELQKEAINLIKASQRILILPSMPVDADSLGAATALHLVLKKLGKEATTVCTENIPNVYSFLPGVSIIQQQFQFVQDLVVTIDCRNVEISNVKPDIQKDKVNIIITPKKGKLDPSLVSLNRGESNFDLIIMVDGGSLEQFKTIYESNIEMFQILPVLNIDHHLSNENFGKVNVVDVMASSTTVILLTLIEQFGPELIDGDIATLLLAGLITDTGSFQNPNTTPDAFAIAARLIELGGRQQEIVQHLYKTKKLSTLKLWGRVLSKLQYDETHRLVWSSIAQKDLTDTQSSLEESEGVIDELMSNAPGTEIVLLLKDRGNGVISGSLRTTTQQLSASMLAEKFGGGGHLQAAGFRVSGKTLEEVEKWTVDTLRQFQKERLKLETMEPLEIGKPVEVRPILTIPDKPIAAENSPNPPQSFQTPLKNPPQEFPAPALTQSPEPPPQFPSPLGI